MPSEWIWTGKTAFVPAGKIAARVTVGGMGRASRGRTGGAEFVVADGRTAFVATDWRTVLVVVFITALVSADSFLWIGFKDNRSFPMA